MIVENRVNKLKILKINNKLPKNKLSRPEIKIIKNNIDFHTF